MDPFKKSLLIHGFLIPLVLTITITIGINTVQVDIQRQYLRKKQVYDEMKKQESILQQAAKQRELLNQELPKIRSYFLPTHIPQATATIAAQCSDEKGLKLGDLKQNATTSVSKSISHQLKLFGRSSPLLEVLGEAQVNHPAIQFDQWSIGIQIDQKILLFQGTLQLAGNP